MRWVVGLTGLLFAGFLAYSYAWSPARSGTPDGLPSLRVGRGELTESTVAVGTIKPKVGAEVKVGSQLSGVVAQLKVNVGDKVKKGDVLASLVDEEWRARVDVLKAQVVAAIAEREYAKSQLEKNENMRELIPLLQIEDSRRNLKVKEATVAQNQASLADAEIQLGYTIIRAPVSGTIASVSTYQGETVAASLAAPTFVTIVDLNRLEVQSFVDETDIGRIRVGQQVAFRVDSYPGHELQGVVQAIYPKAQLVNSVVNYVVIINIVNTEGLEIRPEMTAHVTFPLAHKAGVITIPRKALLRQDGQSLVIARAADRWVERPVETGLQTPDRIEIVSGLHDGDTIVADKQAWKDRQERKQP